MDVQSTNPDLWENGPEAALANVKAVIASPSALEKPPAADRALFLTAEGQAATRLEMEALLDGNDLLETSFLDKCILVRDCVGRIRFTRPDGRGYATGVLIAPGFLMSNNHVFGTAASARGGVVEFGYRYDVAGQLPISTDEFDLRPDLGFLTDPGLDFCVVAVAPTSTLGRPLAERGYLRMIPETGKAKLEEFVTIIQHPDGDAQQIALRENQITRLKDDEPFLWYKADTTHGSSGAPVFNDSLQLVALHSSGRIKRDGQGRYALADGTFSDSLAGLGEKDVLWEANVGYRISRICASLTAMAQAERPDLAPVFEAAMRGGDVLGAAVARANAATPTAPSPASPPVQPPLETEAKTAPPSRGVPAMPLSPAPVAGEIVVPLRLRISLETGGAVGGLVAGADAGEAALQAEALKMRTPVIYDGLDERAGFDAGFLDPAAGPAPMPRLTAAGEKAAAPLLDGSGVELKYAHFSVWMQKERRLALFTASNVDFRSRKKLVDGKSTDRKTLAGFDRDYMEQWVTDPRIAAEHQLPDVFYTEDRQAFDKGHLVRRDDVCWGQTYEDIQMANGDTYHVTNCSPQIKGLNQSAQGVDNWGDLENHLQTATQKDNETAIVFAGPVFGRDDRWFVGKDDFGRVRVQIPTRFWKIVLVKGDAGFEAYGFLLDQDVRAITEAEFYVTRNWSAAWKPLTEIAPLLRGWVSLDELLPCDQYGRVPLREPVR